MPPYKPDDEDDGNNNTDDGCIDCCVGVYTGCGEGDN
jgi:hypothetical protein